MEEIIITVINRPLIRVNIPDAVPSEGNVTGANSSANNEIVVFDGESGKIIKGSGTSVQAINQAIADLATETGQGFTDLEAAIELALGNKVDKVDGKGLSTNDYTNEDQTKLNNLTQGVISDPVSPNSIVSVWSGTQAQWDEIDPKVATTFYFIEE